MTATDPYSDSPFVWRCPRCDRATPKGYRCQNFDCQADLAGKPLEVLKA